MCAAVHSGMLQFLNKAMSRKFSNKTHMLCKHCV